MLDMIARSMERFGSKSAKEPALTHYGVSKLNFDFTLDISRAENELGYKPIVTLDEGITRTAAWLRDHGKLHRVDRVLHFYDEKKNGNPKVAVCYFTVC